MQHTPSATELLDAVASLLQDRVVPSVDAELAHQVRVAAHLAQLVRRELGVAERNDEIERERLRSIADVDEHVELRDLRSALARRLEDRSVTIDVDELERIRGILVATVRADLAISKPGHSAWTEG